MERCLFQLIRHQCSVCLSMSMCVCVRVYHDFLWYFCGFHLYFDSKNRTLRTPYSYQFTKHQTIWKLIKIKIIMWASARIRILNFNGCHHIGTVHLRKGKMKICCTGFVLFDFIDDQIIINWNIQHFDPINTPPLSGNICHKLILSFRGFFFFFIIDASKFNTWHLHAI